ncbi:MAG: CzcE family metal-binding protein [Burkholderiaceae bacterium]|nr:CzcE family metal-binding protein [Burkholderiaceae bacterium]
MKIQNLKAVILAAGLALTAHAAIATSNPTLRNGNSLFGVPAVATAASKVFDVTKGAKALNIACGDVVNFRSGDKTFTWKFDVVNHQTVDLAAIAPAGFSTNSLKVYVSRNEAERN